MRELSIEFSIKNLFELSLKFSKEFSHLIYGSGFENYPELIEAYEKSFFLLGNPASVVRKVRDWIRFYKKLKKLGIAFPETLIVKKEEISDISGKYIVKPIKTAGGKKISFLDEKKEYEGEFILQEYVEGKNISSCIAGNGKECYFVGGSEQLLDRFRYLGNIAPLEIDELEEASIKIGEEFRLVGINGIDWVLGDELYALEVNPRMTGALEVLEKAYSLNLFDLHVNACLGKEINFKPKPSGKFYARKVVYARKNVVFGKRLGFIKDVPKSGEVIERGMPICTILASGENRKSCLKDLEKKESMLNENLW